MTLLTIRSSVNGDASISNQLVNAYVNARQDQNSQQNNHTADTIINRDLSTDAIPVLTAELTAAIRAGQQDSTAQRDAIALSDTLIDELKNADEIVIGLPRYNFHAPASFKAYIDYIARPRITFQYSENGPRDCYPTSLSPSSSPVAASTQKPKKTALANGSSKYWAFLAYTTSASSA